jgi:DNA mismatch repair protein MutS
MFLHQIVRGAADKSYGIHVAQLAGVPRAVNDRAREVLQWLESQHEKAESAADGSAKSLPKAQQVHINGTPPARPSHWQLTLFGVEEHPLLDEIRAANLDEMRPREALDLVHSWQQRLLDETATAQR